MIMNAIITLIDINIVFWTPMSSYSSTTMTTIVMLQESPTTKIPMVSIHTKTLIF